MFSKFGDCIVGPGMPVAKDEETEQLDYEVELGVVIGAPVPRYTQPGKYSKPVWGFLEFHFLFLLNFLFICPPRKR